MADENLLKLLELVRPESNFTSFNTPAEPNYSLKDSWAALPEVDSYQYLVPSDNYSTKKSNDIDVFYIHPTGFFEKKWNFNLDKNSSAYERTEVMLANQASVFNGSCNIYAPAYRQATYYSFFSNNENGLKALDLAYKDIERAFDYYIENFNDGRPFFIYGHSQGALHGQRLIHNRISNTSLKNQFINGYLVGYVIPENSFSDLFPGLTASKNGLDNGSIISWSTVAEGFVRGRASTPHWKPDGWGFQDMTKKIISVNPFSWTSDSSWHEQDVHHCSIINKSNNDVFMDLTMLHHTNSKKSIGTTRIQNFQSRINSENGLLETKGDLIDKMRKMRSFNGDLHSFDVMLFWGSTRQNIIDRINAFL